MAIDRTIDRAWRAVDHIVAALQPGRDERALFTFDTVLREVVPFTTEFDRFDDMTEKGTEKPYGKTSLYDAVADTATLADLARWTGGSVRATSTGDDVREALAHVLEGLRYQDVVDVQARFPARLAPDPDSNVG